VDPLQAGNVVQLLVVLGMTVGWISTYMFRVANKDMTYAQQLRDYEKQVMEVGQRWHHLCSLHNRVAALRLLNSHTCQHCRTETDRPGAAAFVAETAGELVGG
jgi:hypothetical protein